MDRKGGMRDGKGRQSQHPRYVTPIVRPTGPDATDPRVRGASDYVVSPLFCFLLLNLARSEAGSPEEIAQFKRRFNCTKAP